MAKQPTSQTTRDTVSVQMADPVRVEADVQLQRPALKPTDDQALWVAIRNRTDAIGFNRYSQFIRRVFCEEESRRQRETCAGDVLESGVGAPPLGERRKELAARPAIYGVDAYNLLRFATEVFLLLETGVVRMSGGSPVLIDPSSFSPAQEAERLGEEPTVAGIEEKLKRYFGDSTRLPYLRRIIDALPGGNDENLPYCEAVLQYRFSCPSLIELIWSYWQEEGMLVQTMKAIALRFQNRRGPAGRDPLANLALDPLRPLNNLLWGYIQDEPRRLTVIRRAYEYDHHYGLTLVGKALPQLASADSRSKFIEAFHNLLYRTAMFYRDDADTTVIPDGFPLLNALREVHVLLAEGAHNQFGDLPWTARVEMLVEQWFLARDEMQEFLRGRHMVPYQERWMGAVDAMKRLQGWTDVSVTHFHSLAVFGERILLSVRYADWIAIDNTQEQAKNWARYWRPEIQGYIHAYQVVTGVDLAAEVTDSREAAERYVLPSTHLARRLGRQGYEQLPGAPPGVSAELIGHGLSPLPRGRLPRKAEHN